MAAALQHASALHVEFIARIMRADMCAHAYIKFVKQRFSKFRMTRPGPGPQFREFLQSPLLTGCCILLLHTAPWLETYMFLVFFGLLEAEPF